MAITSLHRTIAYLLFFLAVAFAQVVTPSNASDIGSYSTTPRFVVYSSTVASKSFPTFQIAPLSIYASIARSSFLQFQFEGRIVNTNANNANEAKGVDFSFISCDPQDYVNSNLGVNDVLKIVANLQQQNSIILYSRTANHCTVDNLSTLPTVNGIFTTTDPTVAATVAAYNYGQSDNAFATIKPDPASDTNGNGNGAAPGTSNYNPSPTTAIAMIILYSITGIITALFVIIIISGAIRAHRHPERYGPRNIIGRGRQSRAKGIARAMLETLPIVKFGDHEDTPKPNTTGNEDIEMIATSPTTDVASKESTAEKKGAAVTTTALPTTIAGASSSSERLDAKNADGTDETGSLGCSICTEDFQKGEELRVLPCNHKFHPLCVDPWLLNVSGTCPLCRIDLRPAADGQPSSSQTLATDAPPLGAAASNQTGTMQGLRAALSGSREERIAALRRFRHERQRGSVVQNQSSQQTEDGSQAGLARRLRERFRIRTRSHGTPELIEEGSSVSSPSQGMRRY